MTESRKPAVPRSRLQRLPLGAVSILALAWVLAALTFPAVTGAEEPAGRPDLKGAWKLDKDLSDDPAAVMKKSMERRRSYDSGSAPGFGMGRPGGGFGGATGGSRGGGWGGPGGRGGRAAKGSGAAAERPADAEMGRRFDSMDIEPIDGGWSVRYADGQTMDLVPDGQDHVIDLGRGQETVRAEWDGQTLVVHRKSDRREVTERYDVTDDGKLLQVETTMAGGRGGRIQFRRLYRPAPSEEAQPPG